MGKVIQLRFPSKKDDELIKLCHLADDIDSVIKHYIMEEQVGLQDLVGVISHRLGTLLNRIESKDELWQACESVVRKQAKFEESAS